MHDGDRAETAFRSLRAAMAILRPIRGPIIVALTACSLLHAPPANAAEAARVALIHIGDDEPSRRVRAELREAGLDVVDTSVAEGDPRNPAQVARAVGAVAAVRVVSSDEMELVIVDPETGDRLYGKVLRSTTPAADSLALRAVEDLRARLVKLRLVESSPPGDRLADGEPMPSVSRKDSRNAPARGEDASRRPTLWATGALGASTSAGGLGAAPVAHLGLRLDGADRWAVSVSGFLPFSAQSVSEPEAHADVRVYVFDAVFHYEIVAGDTWSLDSGIGGAVVVAKMEGFPDSPVLAGRSEAPIAGAPLANASLSMRAAPIVRLRGELLAGVTVPRIAVTFDGENVATWGRPFAFLVVGAEIGLPLARDAKGPP